jgi:AcrR family transcriptional regulator
MPKGFTEKEKEFIRIKLHEKGKELLSQFGIKKTSVEDLTRAAGISKGAFYLFYPSKEELFLDIFEQTEAQMRIKLLEASNAPDIPAKEGFKTMMKLMVKFLAEEPVMGRMNPEEISYLMRKLPEERLAQHINQDDDFLNNYIKEQQAKGIFEDNIDNDQISGLFKAVVLLSFHREDLGHQYTPTMDLLIDMTANHLLKKEG